MKSEFMRVANAWASDVGTCRENSCLENEIEEGSGLGEYLNRMHGIRESADLVYFVSDKDLHH